MGWRQDRVEERQRGQQSSNREQGGRRPIVYVELVPRQRGKALGKRGQEREEQEERGRPRKLCAKEEGANYIIVR